jgi:spheroidene monooxygenase
VAQTPPSDVFTVSLFRFHGRRNRHWAWWRMLLFRWKLRALPGATFMRQCGCGSDEGFSPVPDFGTYGVLAAWTDMATAKAQVRGAAPYRAYRDRAAHSVTLFLQATRARGAWGGSAPFAAGDHGEAGDEPVAVLTRATVRPSRAAAFWRWTPAIRGAIPNGPGLDLKIGMGDVPWLSQITFSVWSDRAALWRFAADPAGPHGQAARASQTDAYFSESLFARFRIAAVDGAWPGATLRAPARPQPVAA